MNNNIILKCKDILLAVVRNGKLPQQYEVHLDEVCEGAIRGLDVEQFKDLEEWANWLCWSSVVLDETDYLKAATHALGLAPRLAGTDYGTARQRDLGHLWTDTIRGFLGEIAFVKWLRKTFSLNAVLDFRKGLLEEFLPSDLKEIEKRAPKLKVSIKTTKFKGIWLDVPYAQLNHSDIFILVRLGITREHFLAFLKKVSIIREKILKKAFEMGVVSENELNEIWNTIPDFADIPAYIVGFLDKRELVERLDMEKILIVNGKIRGRKNKRFVINRFLGFWHPDEETYKERVFEKYQQQLRASLPNTKNINIEFEGIREFTKTLHFIANSGELKKTREDWEKIVKEL